MVNKFGSVSWEDSDSDTSFNKKTFTKDIFLKLENGSNRMRIITKPHAYLVHKWMSGEAAVPSNKYGYRILCSSTSPGGTCPICEGGEKMDKAKQRWYVGVIDRKTNQYKILDISVTVFNAIKLLNRDSEWGSPETFDIDIKVNRNGGATGYYSVMPVPHKPLSESDIKIKKDVESKYAEELQARCVPPSPEQVKTRMAAVLKFANGPSKANAAPVQSHDDDSADDSSEPNYEFPET